MAAAPHIVSFWKDDKRQEFLCSGVLLDGNRVLTVEHAFKHLHLGGAAFVFLVPGRNDPVRVSLVQRHEDLDAAIFRLDEQVAVVASPALADRYVFATGRQVVLHVIDPKTHNHANPPSFGVSDYDSNCCEYVLNPNTALGWSGGAVEFGGQIIALLNRRMKGHEPIARAISMAALHPWIASVIGPSPDLASRSEEGFERLRLLVGDAILSRLSRDGTSLLRERGGFPGDGLALFGLPEAKLIEHLIVTLYKATKDCFGEWRKQNDPIRSDVKNDCLFILGELIKRAVDTHKVDGVTISNVSPDRMFLVCRRMGTVVAVYCAIRDAPLLVVVRADQTDLGGQSVVDLGVFDAGVGADARSGALEAVWRALFGTSPPADIATPERLELLRQKIRIEQTYFDAVPLLVAQAPREWLDVGGLADAANDLGIGLVLRGAGECPMLLVAEEALVVLAAKYVNLLESL